MLTSPKTTKLLVPTLLIAGLLFSSPAKASGMLGPNTRDFFAGLTLGGGIKLSKSVSQFKLAQEFGWRGLRIGGLAIGATLQESFGDNWTLFAIAPKVWWDFQILSNMGLYVTPFLHMGYQYSSFSFAGQSLGTSAFNWQFGVLGKLIINNRFYVLFQPFAIDLSHSKDGTGARYDIQFGGGLTF